jgi:hypothetical protein
MQFQPSLSNVHYERVIRIRLLGTGAADPTVEFGPSMTVLRQGVGVHRITLAEARGTFIGIGGYIFGAATPGDVKGQTLTRDTWDATNRQLDIAIWSSVFAADELNATEYLDLTLVFADTNKP